MFPAPTTEQLEELKAAHGDDMRIIDYDGMTIVLALPADDAKVGAYYKRFTDSFDAGKKEEAFRGIFPALAVYPDEATLKKVIARRPGMVRSVGQDAAGLLGLVTTDAKKG